MSGVREDISKIKMPNKKYPVIINISAETYEATTYCFLDSRGLKILPPSSCHAGNKFMAVTTIPSHAAKPNVEKKGTISGLPNMGLIRWNASGEGRNIPPSFSINV